MFAEEKYKNIWVQMGLRFQNKKTSPKQGNSEHKLG